MVRSRRVATGVLVLAVAFFLFFGTAKHRLGDVNPFGEDPYDAVGSFGIQVALFAAMLSLLRALRSPDAVEAPPCRASLVLRAAMVSVLAMAATLAADGVALVRYPGLWGGTGSGRILAAWTLAMALLTGLAFRRVARDVAATRIAGPPRTSRKAVAVWLTALVVLAVYPATWRAGVVGAVVTASLGMVLLFLLVRAGAVMFFPHPPTAHEGAFDDLSAVLGELRSRRPALASGVAPLRAIAAWLGGRRRTWGGGALFAAMMGGALTLAEALGEGLSPDRRRAALVVTVILVIEGAGVVLGYALLGDLVGIDRRDGPR